MSELLARKGKYYELYMTQYAGFATSSAGIYVIINQFDPVLTGAALNTEMQGEKIWTFIQH